ADRHHAPHGPAGVAHGARGQAPQRRGPAEPDQRPDAPGVGQGRSHHADRRRRTFPRAHPWLAARVSAQLRARADAGAARGVQRGGWGLARRDARASGASRRTLVIERLGGAALRVYAAHRRRTLEGVARDGARVQEAALLDLVNAARGTAFGRSHRFEQIRSVADYQSRTPLGDYLRFQPLWTRAINDD